MRSYESLMRQAASILTFAHIDDSKVSEIEFTENHCTIGEERHYYRTARINLKNGNHITIRDDASFDCTDEHWNTIDSRDLMK